MTSNDPAKRTRSFTITLALTGLVCFYACQLPKSKTTVSIRGERWHINGVPVLAGSPAEGLLVNVRMVNAVFEDNGPVASEHLPPNFDPEENTARFISRIPDYCDHGIRAFTISLQGGMPGYEGAVNTAFNPDGSLKPEYLQRVANVIRAADENAAVVILSCFYQRQHSNEFALNGKRAILNAVENVVKWIQQEIFKCTPGSFQ